MSRPSIGIGAVIGFVLVPCFWLGPAVFAVLVVPQFLLLWLFSIVLTGAFAIPSPESNISWFPVTYAMRAENRRAIAKENAWELERGADRCRRLAESYRERGQVYDAEILEAEAAHKERQADIRTEDAERIKRELQDREMLKLTKPGQ